MIAAFKGTYKFKDDDIDARVDVSSKEVGKMMMDAMRKVENNHKRNRNTLIVVHYGGHGVSINDTVHTLSNHPPGTKPFYGIENMLRSLSTKPGAYVIGLLDCCRSSHRECSKLQKENV